jgi:hypothetical protein
VLEETCKVVARYATRGGALDPRAVRARHALRQAEVYLAHHPAYATFWNRGAGFRCLTSAIRCDPRIVGTRGFLRLLRRAMLPRSLHRSRSA